MKIFWIALLISTFTFRNFTGSTPVDISKSLIKNVPIKLLHPIMGSELGGTLVKIEVDKDRYIGDFENISCCFDHVLVKANRSKEDIVTCLSPSHEPGLISLFLVTDDSCLDADTYPTDVGIQNYTYTIMATVFSIAPAIGNHGTTVTVTGSGFRNESSLLCRFGNVTVRATFRSDSQIECVCPLVSYQNEINEPTIVSVSNNGIDIEGSWADVMFYYVDSPLLSEVEPSSIPAFHESTLFIRGKHFRHAMTNNILSYCKIGEVIVEANVLSDDEVGCVISHIDVTSDVYLSVSLSVDGGFNFYTDNLLTVHAHLDVTLISVEPPAFSERGGISLQVYGEHIPQNDQLACLFDDVAVVAKWISGSLVICIVPAGKVGTIPFKLSTNGQVSGITDVVYVTYLIDPSVSAIFPTVGPIEGRTSINLYGSGLSANPIFLCQFGDYESTVGTLVNETLATCEVPRVERASSVPIHISVNSGHEYTTTDLLYHYFEPVRIHRIEPNIISAIGGISLVIYGDFQKLSSLDIMCRFKNKSNAHFGKMVDRFDDAIVCLSPIFDGTLSDGLSMMSIDVVLVESVHTSITETELSLVISSDMKVTHVSPTYGSELGGSNVTISGNFSRTGTLSCAFGNSISPYAEWVDSNTILCITPPAEGDIMTSPMVNLSISLNGKDFQNVFIFKYVPAMHISGFEPSSGPITGGTELSIRGEGFVIGSAQAFCIIDDRFELAVVHDSSLMTCRTPPVHNTGVYSVQISFGGGSFVRSDIFFKFYEVPMIVELVPSTVSTRDPMQVHVIGDSFDNLGSVSFRIRNKIIKPYARSENGTVIIVTPNFDEREEFVAHLEISFNGVDFQLSGKLLEFVQPSIIVDVDPPFVHESGNMVMRLIGKGFFRSNSLSCAFLSEDRRIEVPSSYLSSELIECYLPLFQTRPPGIVAVTVSSFGEVLQSDPVVSLPVVREILISSLEPSVVPIDGGSRIFINGRGFDQDIKLFCLFQHQDYTPFRCIAVVESDTVLSCISPALQTSRSFVTNSTIEILGDYGGERYYTLSSKSDQLPQLSFYKEVILEQSDPVYVDRTGNIKIPVKGENFLRNDLLKCSFWFEDIRIDTKAFFLSPSYLECEAPDVQKLFEKNHRVKSMLMVSNNGINFSRNFVSVYHFSIQLEYLSLNRVFEAWVTNITVYGSNFVEDSTLKCEISGLNGRHFVTLAYYESPFITVCTIPELSFGPYSLKIGTNNVFSMNSLQLFVHNDPIIRYFEPSNGPIEGGTLVALHGYNFDENVVWLCAFGRELVRAIWYTEEHVACRSPSVNEEVSIPVSLTHSAQLVKPKGEMFHYLPRPDVHSISPYQGTLIPGSDIVIRGMNMHSPFAETSVLFGEILIIPKLYFHDMLTISLPPEIEIKPEVDCVPIFVTLNRGRDFSKPGLCFIMSKQPTILDINPKFGLVTGGNIVTLYGDNFLPGSQSKCRFGTNTVRAKVVSNNYIECIAPFSSHPGEVTIQYSSDDVVWTEGNYTYKYELPMDISHVVPSVLMTRDRTILHFIGKNIPKSSPFFCQFQDYGRSSIVKLSDTEFTCMSPPSIEEGVINLSIVSEDVVVTREIAFQLQYRHPYNWRIPTTFGPLQGGTALYTNIDDLGLDVFQETIASYFLFEDKSYLSVPVTILNSTTARFVTPDISLLRIGETLVHSKVLLRVNGNPFDSIFKTDFPPLHFTFKKTPTNCKIHPNISDYNGGIDIRITGEYLGGFWLNSSALLCRFGSNDVTAKWISPYRIDCKVPPIQKHTGMTIPVFVTDNGENFISAGMFTYIDHPRIGWVKPSFVAFGRKTTIIVNSFNLEKFSDISCCFETSAGVAFDPLVISNSSTGYCDVLVDFESESINVSLSIDGKTCSAEGVELFSVRPVSLDIYPTRLPLHKFSTIHMRGILPNHLPLECRLKSDENIIVGLMQVVSEHLALCHVVCENEFAFYTFDVLHQNVIIFSHHDFYCDPIPALIEVEPNILRNDNGSSILIRGRDFRDTTRLSCSFRHLKGVFYSEASFYDTEKIECHVPKLFTSTLDISVSNNGYHYSEGLQIERYDNLFAVSVTSTSQFGDTIYFEGEFKNHLDRISCMIDNIPLHIVSVNTKKAFCQCSSSLSIGGSYRVRLLIDNKFVIPGSEKDIYLDANPKVQNIIPSAGLREIKQSIQVYGENFIFGDRKSVV